MIALGSWTLTPPAPLPEGDGIVEATDPVAAVQAALDAAGAGA